MVETAFFIALTLGLLKLSEMALRPHQKKWVQQRMETLTLTADYRTSGYRNWLALLRRTTKSQINGTALVVFVLSVILIATERDTLAKAGLIGLFVALQFGLAAWMWNRAPEFFDWAQIGQGSIRSLVRVFGLASYVLFTNIFSRLPDKYLEEIPLILIVPLAIASMGLLIYFLWNPGKWITWNIFSIIVFPISLALGIWAIAAVTSRAAVGLLWRVVEYPSGAWAAVLFLVTGILGLVKAYLG